jgi:hypothetical protein
MLGDGIVSLGVAVLTHSWRNVNASAKIGARRATRSVTCSAAGENSIEPCSLRNCTLRLSSLIVVIPPSW